MTLLGQHLAAIEIERWKPTLTLTVTKEPEMTATFKGNSSRILHPDWNYKICQWASD
ncbi:hypothetical protein [Methylobacter sp.]|uniref:hypothetical protein n=1 Tax=Methylobacter sp. TaxID=2051955 RepID=UPI002FDE68F4